MLGVIAMTDRTENTSNTDGQGEQPTACDGRGPALVQVPYDPAADDLTTTIVRAIAKAEDVSITTIKDPPLYSVIDTAALDRSLFDGKLDLPSKERTGGVKFEYYGYMIIVEADGWVRVHEPG